MKWINNKRNELFLSNILFSVLILIIILSQVKNVIGPVVMPDEIGYWASAAAFSGRDWSGTMKVAPYYGYGYGLVFAFLFKVFKDPVLMFRVSICINAIMLIGIFLLSHYIVRTLKPNLKPLISGCISFAVTVYPYNIYYSLLTGSEILQVLIYMLICTLLLKSCMSDQHINIQICCMAVLSVYMLACHQRNLGILFILSFTIFMFFLSKRISVKSFLVYIISLSIGILIFLYLKNYINGNVYHVLEYTSEEANKIQGALGVFSIPGIKSFVKLMFGRFFYLGCASFLLVFWGIWELSKKIIKFPIIMLKQKAIFVDNKIFFELFILLVLLCEMAIGALAFLGNSIRIDGFFYGRYNEHVIIPIIIIGIISIYDNKNNFKIQLNLTVLLGILAIMFRYIFYTNNTMQTSSHSISSIIGMPIFAYVTENNIQFLYSIGLACLSIIISWIVYSFLCCKFEKAKLTGVFLIIVFWLFFAINALYIYIYSFTEYNQDLYEFSIEMEDILEDETVYQAVDLEREALSPTSSTWLIYRIRFFLRDVDVNVIDIKEVGTQEYIMVYKGSGENQLVSELNYSIIAESERMCLYHKSDMDISLK